MVREERQGARAYGSSIDTAQTPGKGRSALVIEDDVLIAMDLEDMLRQLGFEDVEVAHTTDEVQAAGGRSFGVVIADLHLGPKTSLPHLHVFADAGIPLIISSGSVPSERAQAPYRSVALEKPYTLADLRAALRSAGAL